MRLTTLSDNTLILEQYMQGSRNILRESCDGLTSQQQYVVENVYNALVPLIEASLTADQVKHLFGEIEKQSIAGGQSRSVAGNLVDAAKEANKVIDKMGKWLQDTTPVKAFDQKFEDLKAKINKKFPDSKLLDGISNLAIWVEQNPGKSAAVIGVLTALASLAAGPVGGAIAGQVLKGATELLKGEKLSTAIGKGFKAAAVGWLAGKSMEAVGKMISNAYEYFNPQPITGFARYYEQNIGNGLPNIFRDASIMGTQEQLNQFNGMWGEAVKKWQSGDFEGAKAAFDSASSFGSKITDATLAAIGTDDPGEPIRKINDLFAGLSAAAQGAATGAAGYDRQGNPVTEPAKESYYVQTRPLSEGQVYMLFNKILSEAGILSKLKAGADWVGKQATETITSAKLLASWKMSGSPTDSEELKNFLVDNGVDQAIIDKVYADMKLSAAPSIEEIEKLIATLNTNDKQEMIAYLTQDLGIQ